MKNIFKLGSGCVFALVLAGCATVSVPQGSEEEYKVLLKNHQQYIDFAVSSEKDLYTHQTRRAFGDYKSKRLHKAFAQSASGAWAYKSGFNDPILAVESALGKCELNNKGYRVEKPCKLVNVDGIWASQLRTN